MKRIIQSSFAAFLLFLSAAPVAQAQDNPAPVERRRGGPGGGDPQQMAERQTAHMTDALKLTPQQRSSVQTINLKYAQQRKSLFEANRDADREAMRPKMDALQQQQDAELDQVLTADQRATWQKVKAERGPGHRGEGKSWDKGKGQGKQGANLTPEQRADQQTARMTENLKLSESQQKKVRDINLKYAKQAEKDRKKIKTAREKKHAELNAVLTSEQQAAWKKQSAGKGKKGKGGRSQE